MFVLDGRQLVPGRPFEHGGVKYPSNWLRLASFEDKQALGIEERPDPAPVDTRFYWDHDLPKRLEDEPAVDEDGDPVLDADGVQIINKGLKTEWIAKQKEIAASLFAPTDWYVIRKADTGIDVPAAVKQYRDDVRITSGLREDQIAQVSTTEELAALVTNPSEIVVVTPPAALGDEETITRSTNPEPHLTPWPEQLSA